MTGALITDNFALLAVLFLVVALADWMGRQRWARRIGGAIIVILLGALLANLRIIPPAGGGGAVYDLIFSVAVPAAIFLLLLDVNLAALRRAGGAVIGAFALGALGTVVGVLIATWALPVRALLADATAPMAGMFTGTYIGGSANFNAIALAYDVVKDGPIYTSAVVVDNVMTDVWIILLLTLPSLLYRLARFGPRPEAGPTDETSKAVVEALPGSLGVAVLLAMTFAALLLSNFLSAWLARAGIVIPSILIVTTLALLAAQFPFARRLTLAPPVGMWTILLFLAVVGASADLAALAAARDIGLLLFAYVAIVFLVHGAILLAGGWLWRIDPIILAIASSANIGGASTAFVQAEAEGRSDLVLPAILIGSLGTALGTYAGFAVAALLS